MRAHKHGRRAEAIAKAETWQALTAAAMRDDPYDPYPWQMRFWLWRLSQYRKVAKWLNKWRGVWRARRRQQPHRRRAQFQVGAVMYLHPMTLAAFTKELSRHEANGLYDLRLVVSPFVPEWRDVQELDEVGYPPWSPRFSGFRKVDTLDQIFNTVALLDPGAIESDAHWFRQARGMLETGVQATARYEA